MRCYVFLGVLAVAPACASNLDAASGTTSGSAAMPPGVDAGAPATVTDFDREMMQIAMSYKSFSKIDSKPYMSTAGAFQINVYATGDVTDYRTIHPEVSGSNVTLSVGTVIVREVLDGSGKTAELTMLAKGPSGYDPTIGDWWWGDVDPSGTPIMMGGVPQVGRLTDCHSCHLPRATDDYLFGVPKADQPKHP